MGADGGGGASLTKANRLLSKKTALPLDNPRNAFYKADAVNDVLRRSGPR